MALSEQTTKLEKDASGPSAELRFEFGKNWSNFLSVLDEERISEAKRSLREQLEVSDLQGKRFLDIGSGSGLFSLAARQLGATVHSFDYDANSVACTAELKRRYFPEDDHWSIEQGSILDQSYLASLGQFDIVYSWGVLHHTGAMWQALDNARQLVADDGRLFIAIYDDRGFKSRRWTMVKRLYNQSPKFIRPMIIAGVVLFLAYRRAVRGLLLLDKPLAIKRWSNVKKNRGMSFWYNLVDWVGGYPYEVAKPEAVFRFCWERGFALENLTTAISEMGNNQFVFRKRTSRGAVASPEPLPPDKVVLRRAG